MVGKMGLEVYRTFRLYANKFNSRKPICMKGRQRAMVISKPVPRASRGGKESERGPLLYRQQVLMPSQLAIAQPATAVGFTAVIESEEGGG